MTRERKETEREKADNPCSRARMMYLSNVTFSRESPLENSRADLNAKRHAREEASGRLISPAHGAWQLLCSLRLSSCLRGLPARVPEKKMYLRNEGNEGTPLLQVCAALKEHARKRCARSVDDQRIASKRAFHIRSKFPIWKTNPFRLCRFNFYLQSKQILCFRSYSKYYTWKAAAISYSLEH